MQFKLSHVGTIQEARHVHGHPIHGHPIHGHPVPGYDVLTDTDHMTIVWHQHGAKVVPWWGAPLFCFYLMNRTIHRTIHLTPFILRQVNATGMLGWLGLGPELVFRKGFSFGLGLRLWFGTGKSEKVSWDEIKMSWGEYKWHTQIFSSPLRLTEYFAVAGFSSEINNLAA